MGERFRLSLNTQINKLFFSYQSLQTGICNIFFKRKIRVHKTLYECFYVITHDDKVFVYDHCSSQF